MRLTERFPNKYPIAGPTCDLHDGLRNSNLVPLYTHKYISLERPGLCNHCKGCSPLVGGIQSSKACTISSLTEGNIVPRFFVS